MKAITIALSTALILATTSAFAGTALKVRAEEADGTLIDSDTVHSLKAAKLFRENVKATWCAGKKGQSWYYQVGKQKRVKNTCR